MRIDFCNKGESDLDRIRLIHHPTPEQNVLAFVILALDDSTELASRGDGESNFAGGVVFELVEDADGDGVFSRR